MEYTSKVYIKTDEKNNIIAIDGGYSIGNIVNPSEWILIDDGYGDRFNLCQNNYLEKPIIEEHGLYRYAYINGQIVEKDLTEEIAELERISALKNERSELIGRLESFDYIGTKIAMGVATIDEYAEEIAETQTIRSRINEIDSLLNL